MEDEKIVELYWAREERAIAETEKKYSNYLSAVAFRLLGDRRDVQECLSDTYLGAWNSIPPHRPRVLRTYLAKLTRRIAMKLWRSRDTQKRGCGEVALSLEELGQCIPDGKAIDENLTARELAAAIEAFLQTLTVEERRVFLRRYFYGWPIREICRENVFSKSKTESMLYRLRERLKAHLQKEGYLYER